MWRAQLASNPTHTCMWRAQKGQWARLLWSALLHGDDMHIFLNMSSFLYKVRSLAKRVAQESSLLPSMYLTLLNQSL